MPVLCSSCRRTSAPPSEVIRHVRKRIAAVEAPNQISASQFLRRPQWLSERLESSRSLQRSDHQSHTEQDARANAKVTSNSRNVLQSLGMSLLPGALLR